MHIYIYIYTYIFTFTCIDIHIYTYTYTYTCTCMFTYTYIYIYKDFFAAGGGIGAMMPANKQEEALTHEQRKEVRFRSCITHIKTPVSLILRLLNHSS